MIRSRSRLVPVPWPGSPGPQFVANLEVRWESGDDPLPFLRLIAHWQVVGGGEAFIPSVNDGRVGVLA